MRRAASTLLVIRSGFIARADFGAGAKPALLNVWKQSRQAGVQTAELVDSALALGPGCGKRVWVLNEDVWTQHLSVPASSVAGLTEEHLSRALCFEAEPLSGISALEAAAAIQPVAAPPDGQRTFWVTLIDRFERDSIQALVRKAGGRLAGILHPGGVPAALNAQAAGSWRRVETWNRAAVCIAKAVGQQAEVLVLGSARGQANVSAWAGRTAAESAEWLGDEDPQFEGAHTWMRFSLNQERDLSTWLSAWAAQLSSARIDAPMIVPGVQPYSTRAYVTFAIMAEVAAIVLCVAHWRSIGRQRLEIDAAAAKYQEPVKLIAQLTKRTSELSAEFDKLAAQNNQMEKDQRESDAEIAMRRTRVLSLVREISEQRPGDAMVQSLVSEGSAVLKLRGICMTPSQADEFASRLGQKLGPSGWEIQPAEKRASQIFEGGGPWEFALSLRSTANQRVQVRPAQTASVD